MKLEVYEKNYVVAEDAEKVLSRIQPVVEFMQSHTGKPMSCKEIGQAMYGENYTAKPKDWWDRYDHPEKYMTPQKLVNILRHLAEINLVNVEKVDGAPIEITYEKYVEEEVTEPYYIEVTDALGHTYTINNPKWHRPMGGWQTVTETIVPKVRVYTWIGEN